MTRDQWVTQYRACRVADKLWTFMGGAGVGVPSFVETTPGMMDFDFCRKLPDRLASFPLNGRTMPAQRQLSSIRMYLPRPVRLPK